MARVDVTRSIRNNTVDIETLLSAEQANERVLIAALAALEESGLSEQCPNYITTLEAAIQSHPPYGTRAYEEAYQEASEHRLWLAASLLTNSHREGEGAMRLWSLASRCRDAEVQKLLKQHAVDESNHATFYLSLLDLVLPEVIDEHFRLEVRQLSPGYTMATPLSIVADSLYEREPTIDDFIQMNIAEIRTTLHHLMQRRALIKITNTQSASRVTKLLDRLLRDELRHVSYTAVLIETLSKEAGIERLMKLYRKRFDDFNNITILEFERGVFD